MHGQAVATDARRKRRDLMWLDAEWRRSPTEYQGQPAQRIECTREGMQDSRSRALYACVLQRVRSIGEDRADDAGSTGQGQNTQARGEVTVGSPEAKRKDGPIRVVTAHVVSPPFFLFIFSLFI
jgi:hypothetical protein